MFHSQYYLVVTDIYIQSLQSQVHTHTHTHTQHTTRAHTHTRAHARSLYLSLYREATQAEEIKMYCNTSEFRVPRKSSRLPFWPRVPWFRQS